MATQAVLSAYERAYIVQGISCNVREDGRGCLDMRNIVLETGVLSNTYGSARLQLGETEVLVV